jgi:Rab3 GTPase-activating protein non-catalytic subunit
MFHNDTVMKLKCRSYEPARFMGWKSHPEELEILYSNNVLVCIDGCSLYHYLKAARIFSARLSQDDNQNEMNDMMSSISLDYKKWRLDKQEVLVDFTSSGAISENRFDQLFGASMIGGESETFQSIPPVSNRYITCGNGPYAGFYYAIEGDEKPILSEQAKEFASKMTSAFFNAAKGWIFSNNKKTTPPPSTTTAQSNSLQTTAVKIEPATNLHARFGIPDTRRNGERIIIAPGNNLAAIADSFARVILIDVYKGIAIRIFKGYRDAQIAWICVDDESDETIINKRYALYLIIYAPRRGLLEIWGCQQGTRIASFNVGKDSKLIYPGYFMLTLNGTLSNQQAKQSQQIQCLLMKSDGTLKSLQIPFHLILSDKSNQRVRDTILLKKIKSMLREQQQQQRQKENDIDESLWTNLIVLLNEFKTPSIKQQAIERMINTNFLSARKLFQMIAHELETIDKKIHENQGIESYQMKEYCKFNYHLMNFYNFIDDLAIQQKLEQQNDHLTSTVQFQAEKMQINEDKLNDFYKLNEKFDDLNNKRQQNNENKKINEFNLSDYLGCFTFNTNKPLNETPSATEITNHDNQFESLQLRKDLETKEKQAIGNYLFSTFLLNSYVFDDTVFRRFIDSITLERIDLLVI